jgi:trehalose-phosphatase
VTRFPRRVEALLAAAAAAPRLMLLLDFDGTLAPIRRRPELARLGPSERALLRRLNREGARVAVVSGRSLADLRLRVGLPDVHYVGVFGLQAAEPGWRWTHPRARAAARALAALAARLRRAFADLPGVIVENKGAGVSVHYRAVPASRRGPFDRRLRRVRALAVRGVRWRRGQRAWEATPVAAWDKGRAVLMLWRRHGRPFLVALGDDRFDEPMFRAARGRGGGLRVGTGRTAARQRLRDTGEVFRFLEELERRRARARQTPLLSESQYALRRRTASENSSKSTGLTT